MKQQDIADRLRAEQEALRDCETIPIHNIGYIQAKGYLMAVDTKSSIVVSVSENITDLFALSIDKILGANVSDILPREIVHQCNNARGHSTIGDQREYVGRLTHKDLVKDVFAHVKKERLILEFQFTDQEKSSNIKMLENVHQVISRISSITDVNQLLEEAVFELFAISGYDRVKAYQFLNDGSGEVVAESKEYKMDSYLGHRFPAFDIPESARRLYETTPIRIITNVNADQVKLISHDAQLEPLDLSLALFRGTIAVHMIYLQNMGLGSTLSLPITVNGKMWGLFAFHHMNERILSSDKLAALEMLGSSISLILNSILYNRRLKYIAECTRVASALFVKNDVDVDPSADGDNVHSELSALINCDGVGLINALRFDSYGNCLSENLTRRLCKYLDKIIEVEGSDPKPIAIESIESNYPDLDCGDIAGVLAIPKPTPSYDYLLYFRKDASKIIRWAGDPTKDLVETKDGFRLTPRGSFEEYQELKQKTSDSFENEDMAIAETLSGSLSKVLSTIVVQSQHRQRMGLVIRELNHRVRNMLALIGSFINQSKGSSHNIEDFVSKLETRLMALSETQKLLTEYDWEEVNIQELFEHSLIPYHQYLGNQLKLQGDEVLLSPPLASLLALVLNELASNASKYGALSNGKGEVELTWQYEPGELSVIWKEKGGPNVEEPTRQGFGTTLIKEALYYEFNAKCSLDFDPGGVVAKFVIPVEDSKFKNKTDIKLETKAPLVEPITLDSFKALILEDDYIISKEMTSQLNALGASEVDAVPTIEAARDCIENRTYDIAFLDANIRGEFSVGIAELLEEKGIPFAFATGFGSKVQELNNTVCLKILSKPVSKADLLSVLKIAKLKLADE